MYNFINWCNLGSQSSMVIILSTLLIAAIFQPLRLRFQSVIDRRFYRSKYNAEHILDSFSNYLRKEVKLEEIQRYITSAVEETVQPVNATLWLVKKK